MAIDNTARIETLADAGRYLGELGSRHGFTEGIRRVRSHSQSQVAEQLGMLESYVSGETAEPPGPELRLIGEVVRNAPEGSDMGKAIGATSAAMTQARKLAAQVRIGLPGDLFYVITLLLVASIVVLMWYMSIAPNFARLFGQFGASLPGLSQMAVDQPWILFVPIAIIAAAVAWLVATSFRVASAIAAIAPLAESLPVGRRLRRAHRRWRAVTLAGALAAGGQPVDQVLASVAAIGGPGAGPEPDLAQKLALAGELGVANAELDHLTEQELTSLQRELDTWRAAMMRILQVVIAIFVGVMVVAMYLPIFKMGAVV